MAYFTYISSDWTLRNKLHKDIFNFLESQNRLIIPDKDLLSFKKQILTGIVHENNRNPKCNAITAHWEETDSQGDCYLWLGSGMICKFNIYKSKGHHHEA